MRKLILAAAGLPVLLGMAGVGWYLVSPLFLTRAVDEDFPAPDPAQLEATQAMNAAMAEPTKQMEEPMPGGAAAEAELLARGEFYPVAHEGRGVAGVYQLDDGRRLLRFEGFEVLNGPDLHVWLVPVASVPNTIGVEIPGYYDLGELKGNIGDQNYDFPTDLDQTGPWSVVIWCVPFRVPFAAALLAAP